ncbi:iron-containing alcohol dehydrogenase [Pseudomonas tolaasii]|nr:iron-containing alcohol dehydrogenase [Pseudomonas tolaasii]
MDVGKSIALELNLPTLAIPTTYSGSEMINAFDLNDRETTKTISNNEILPRTVLYDPELTADLPLDFSISSAISAIAHGAEGLYSKSHDPVTKLIAQAGIKALARAIPTLRRYGDGISEMGDILAARTNALYGAWLYGSVRNKVTMSLHYQLCQILCRGFNLSYVDVHSVIVPHVLAYNEIFEPEAMDNIVNAISAPHAPQGMYDLAFSNCAPTALRDIGMRESDLIRARELVMMSEHVNLRGLEINAFSVLLRNAFEGRPPCSV